MIEQENKHEDEQDMKRFEDREKNSRTADRKETYHAFISEDSTRLERRVDKAYDDLKRRFS